MRHRVRGCVAIVVVLLATGCFTAFDFDGTDRASLVWSGWSGSGPTASLVWHEGPSILASDVGTSLVAVGGDYDGSGRWEPATVDLATGDWVTHGSAGTLHAPPPPMLATSSLYHPVPVPADYDGDHKTDPVWYRETDGMWFLPGQAPIQLGAGPTTLATTTTRTLDAWDQDVAVPADHDGDGKADLAYLDTSGASLVWHVPGVAPVDVGSNGFPVELPPSIVTSLARLTYLGRCVYDGSYCEAR